MDAQPDAVNAMTSSPRVMTDKRFMAISSSLEGVGSHLARPFFATFKQAVAVQAGGPSVRFRHMDHDGTWTIAGYRPKSLHHLIEDGPLGFGNTLSGRHR